MSFFCKHCEIVEYVSHWHEDIQQILKMYQTIKSWAYILHDKCDTAPHYHVYLNFGGSSVSTADIAKWFKLGYTDEKGVEHSGEQFIEKIKGRKSDMYKYLTHANAPHKYQYSWDEVIANFNVKQESVNSDIIGHYDKFSYAQQIAYVSNLPPDDRAKLVSKMDKLWKLRCKELTLQGSRDMQVVFITGKAGTGKTFYAKRLLDSLGYDFAVSSSSNDIFQDYLGQRAILLDDLRDSAFRFSDLLKILDNHTRSTCFSRFTNKPIDCRMLVITSLYRSNIGIVRRKLK